MAIIVTEEGAPRVPLLTTFLWLAVLAGTAVAVYYVFFAEVETVDVAIPPNYQHIDPLASVRLDPKSVVQSEAFRSLKPYVPLPVPGNAGRENPFIVVP